MRSSDCLCEILQSFKKSYTAASASADDHSLLNVTNLDRELEWVRYSGMPAGSQSEDQSPLGLGA
jgi:hypothetical protein